MVKKKEIKGSITFESEELKDFATQMAKLMNRSLSNYINWLILRDQQQFMEEFKDEMYSKTLVEGYSPEKEAEDLKKLKEMIGKKNIIKFTMKGGEQK